MSWCGRCFTVQTTSDFESEDDGEYEYFVNSPYICMRKKSEDPSSRTSHLVETRSSLSRTGESINSCSSHQMSSFAQSRSKLRHAFKASGSRTDNEAPRFHTSNKESSLSSSELKDARVWQVGHAIMKPNEQSIQPFFDTSNSESDRTLEIVFDSTRREAESPSQATRSPDLAVQAYRTGLLATAATSMVTIDHSPIMTPKKRLGFIQRLFGRSGKRTTALGNDVKGQASIFKERMELESPAETTKTLYWTFKVKLK